MKGMKLINVIEVMKKSPDSTNTKRQRSNENNESFHERCAERRT